MRKVGPPYGRRQGQLVAALFVLGLLLVPVCAWGQGARPEDDVVLRNQNGLAIILPGASIYVCAAAATVNFNNTPPCTTTPAYTDPALTMLQTQPFLADGNGNFTLYVTACATYTLAFTNPGAVGFSKQWTSPCVNAASPSFTNVTVTGTCSGCATLGSAVLTSANIWTANQDFKGPIPFVDLVAYGARPLATNLGTLAQTGTISSGSASLTLSAIGQYQNGDNIVVVGAGSGNSAGTSAPSAPTVTPSVATGPLNTGETAASATGSTTYSYEMMWCDLATMACTPPSAATTIANGQATLGLTTVSITSIARSGTAATVTAAAPHFLPLLGSCNQTACPEVQVWKGSDASFTGFSRIISTADNTHFVYTTPSSTTYGATASSTGGQFEYFLGNHIACGSAPTATSICVIYGRAAGSYTFIGAGIMGNTYWDDWGTTISGNPLRPAWIPNTPPATFQNNSLNTTISAGAGTTSVTLAANASTSVTSQYTTIDECPILQSAVNAAIATGSQVYIPPSTNYFVIGSYCSLAANAQIRQAGLLWLTSPIAMTGARNNWIANQNSTTLQSGIYVSNTAPGLYLSSSFSSSTLDGLNIQSQNANNALLVLSDQGTGVIVKNYNFQAGSGGNVSYLGMSEVVRGIGFDNTWDTGSMLGDYTNGGSHLGDTTAPNLLFASTGGSVGAFIRNGLIWYAKGIAQTGNDQMDITIDHMHIQGPIQPTYTTDSTSSNGAVTFEHIINDSTAAPIFAPLNGFTQTVRMNFVARSSDTNGLPPVVSGASVGDLEIINNAQTPIGQNFNVRIGSAAGNNAGQFPYQYGSYIVPSSNPSVIGFEQLLNPTSAVVSAGGSLSTSQHCYVVTINFPSGLESAPGIQQCATPTTGNQTITVNWTNLLGFTYNVYRDGARNNNGPVAGTPYVDNGSAGPGQSIPSFSADGYPHIGSINILAPVLGCEETTAPSGVASLDLLYCDSTAHRWKMNNNNAGADTVVGASTSDTLTNKTLSSPLVVGIINGNVDFLGALMLANQGTNCTNGELALSAGWGGTASVGSVKGVGNQTCEWTITSSGAGQAANPTITDTLIVTMPSAALCTMDMHGGTGTFTMIDNTTLSSTAPIFTFNGTPVAASTYIVSRRCGP